MSVMWKPYRIILFIILVFCATNSRTQTIIIDEDFENGSMPFGWTQFTLSSDGGWKTGDSLTLSSQYFRIPQHSSFIATNDNSCQCDKRSDYLITPYLDFSEINTVFMNFDLYFEGEKNWGTGAEFNAEKATVEISIDSGETWEVVDSLSGLKYKWRNEELNLSEYGGNQAVLLAFKYNDYSYFSSYQGYGCAIDNVIIYEPVQRDLQFLSIDNPAYSLAGATLISGSFRNMGADTVYSYEVNYQINDSTLVTSLISGGAISPYDFDSFTHPVSFSPLPGIDTLKVWLGNVNGMGPDDVSSNDSLIKIISFVPLFAERKVLVEDFTSANCTGCAQDNDWLNPFLSDNESKISQVRYHGLTDDMYYYNPAENDDRADYYNISAYPAIFTDGRNIPINQDAIDSMCSIPALFSIQMSASYNDSLINFSVTSTSLADIISGSLKVNIVLVENVTYSDPPGVNGETYFPYVMRKMFPDEGGYSIGKPTINQQNQFDCTFNLDTLVRPDSMFAVAFIQDKYSREVFQSMRIAVLPENANTVIDYKTSEDVLIYPQPATDMIFIEFDNKEDVNEIRIYDIAGKLILDEVNLEFAGNHILSLDVSSLKSGLYLLEANGGKFCRELISIAR